MTLLNPSYETICASIIVSDGKFSIRDYAEGLNVSLITSTLPLPLPLANWTTASELAAQTLLYYFVGDNSDNEGV